MEVCPFPNAQLNPDLFIPKTCLPYLASRQPTLVEDEYYLSEGLKIVELPGHTQGDIGLLCEKGGLLVAGDAIKNARNLYFRDLGMCFDSQASGVASLEKKAKLPIKFFKDMTASSLSSTETFQDDQRRK